MAKKPTTGRGSSSQQTDPLQRCIVEAQRAGKTIAEIAVEAGVSTKTVNEGKKGEFSVEARQIGSEQNPDNRKLRGLVAKLMRLAVHFELDPQETITHYGLPDTEAVKTAISQSRRAIGKPSIVDDTTLFSIQVREPKSTDIDIEERAVIGLLKWKPFFWEPVENSFADRFMRALIGSVSPFIEYERLELEKLSDCFDCLLGRPPKCDAVFGLYDTTYRRYRNLDFVKVPGFKIRLGAVAAANSKVTWSTLLAGSEEDLHPVVLKEEVGHLYYQGTCGFRPPTAITVTNPGECATHFFEAWKKQQWRKGKQVVFVADTSSCVELLRSLEGIAEAKSKFAMVEHRDGVPEEAPPEYSVGIAVRADSPRWRSLLDAAVTDQLLGAACLRTARMYIDAFAQIREHKVDVRWDWLSFHHSAHLFKSCVELNVTNQVNPDYLHQVLPEAWSNIGDSTKGSMQNE